MDKETFLRNKRILCGMIGKKIPFTVYNMMNEGIDEDFVTDMFRFGVFTYMKDKKTVWINWKDDNPLNHKNMKSVQRYYEEMKGNTINLYDINELCRKNPNNTYVGEYGNYTIKHNQNNECSCGTTVISSNNEEKSIIIVWKACEITVDSTDKEILKDFLEPILEACQKLFETDELLDSMDFIEFYIDGEEIDDMEIIDLLDFIEE
jgi:hypothetical protein